MTTYFATVVPSERLFKGHSTFLLWLLRLLLLLLLLLGLYPIILFRFEPGLVTHIPLPFALVAEKVAMVGTSFTSGLLRVQEFLFNPFSLRHLAALVAFNCLPC